MVCKRFRGCKKGRSDRRPAHCPRRWARHVHLSCATLVSLAGKIRFGNRSTSRHPVVCAMVVPHQLCCLHSRSARAHLARILFLAGQRHRAISGAGDSLALSPDTILDPLGIDKNCAAEKWRSRGKGIAERYRRDAVAIAGKKRTEATVAPCSRFTSCAE